MGVSKEQWLDWVKNPVTEQFKKEASEAVEVMAANVLNSQEAGMRECWQKGYIKGVQTILEYRPEEFIDEI